MSRREGAPVRHKPFALDVDQSLRLIRVALESHPAPEQLPRRPNDALEPDVYWSNRKERRNDIDGMFATARWLQRVDEARQRNRANLNALLWACRTLHDVVPEDQRGEMGLKLTTALVGNWGMRVDVPNDLAGCRVLANAYGTPRWVEINQRRQEAAE